MHAVCVASKEDESDFSYYTLMGIETIPSKHFCAQFHRLARDSLVPEAGEIVLRWCPSENINVELRPFSRSPVTPSLPPPPQGGKGKDDYKPVHELAAAVELLGGH